MGQPEEIEEKHTEQAEPTEQEKEQQPAETELTESVPQEEEAEEGSGPTPVIRGVPQSSFLLQGKGERRLFKFPCFSKASWLNMVGVLAIFRSAAVPGQLPV